MGNNLTLDILSYSRTLHMAPASEGEIVRLRFETIFLIFIWVAVILLIALYPHFATH